MTAVQKPVSRRGLLARAAAAIASIGFGAAVTTVASGVRPPAARAGTLGHDDHVNIQTGGNYDTTLATSITNWTNNTPVLSIHGDHGAALLVSSKDELGLQAFSVHKRGIHASSTDDTGVHGESTARWGVYGQSRDDVGVRGTSKNLFGVYAQSDGAEGILGVTTIASAGVRAESADGTALYGYSGVYQGTRSIPAKVGVYGQSEGGRGGVFAGGASQLRLVPSTKNTHPTSGQAGDLYLDSTKSLWLCKGGTSWVKLG